MALKTQSKPILFALSVIASLLYLQTAPLYAKDRQTAVVAGGCFWCVESDFEGVDGVEEVVSGYTGGHSENPSYKDVTRGKGGHYEAVEITYDADKISYGEILNLFFRSIDPTDAGGQFCDRGDSYRSAIFVANEAERKIAQKAKTQAQKDLGQTIVTPIIDAGPFYMAEAYHQNYYKSSGFVFTRRGPKSKKAAYKFYREACGRDARVKDLWGAKAAFAK